MKFRDNPRNENLNLLVRIKFLNLFYWSWAGGPVLIVKTEGNQTSVYPDLIYTQDTQVS
jgi:hypothetical protein